MLQTQVQYWTLQESKRHNLVSEGLQGESNAIQREQVNVNWFTAKENQRHNQEQERIGWTNANENIRHNKATEGLGWATLGETKRHNVQQEGIGWRNASANVTQAQAATRNSMATYGRYQLESEMQPYKIQTEQSRDVLQEAQAANTLTQARFAGTDRKLQAWGIIGNMWGNSVNAMGRIYGSKQGTTKKGGR